MTQEVDITERIHSRQPLRILLVVEPGIDGVFHIVDQLATRLMFEGHAVSLAYSDRRSGSGLKRLIERVQQAGGETLNLRVGNAPEVGDLGAFLRLARMARRWQPDVIHAHSSKAGVLARALVFVGVRARVFYSPHAYYGLSGRRGLKTKVFNLIESVFGRIGTTCACSQGEAEFGVKALGLPAARIQCVSNPIDVEAFAPQRDQDAAKARFGLPADAVVLGTIGRLSFQKHPELLYRSFAAVAGEFPRLHLLHVGQGELDAELQDLARELGIAERITRVQYLDAPREAYAAMDGFALSSRYEGLSLVLLEALACDLPLIVTRVAGVADLQPERLSHCWTADSEDAVGFERALRAWLADRSNDRPRNHRTVATERFGLAQWVERHLALYHGAA